MSRRSALRETLLNLLLSAVTVVLFLGSGEGLCRLLERKARAAPPVATYIAGWQNWDGDFYTVKSSAFGWPPWEDYNSEGLRDREHDVAKRPGTWRIVCLGDSVTLGGLIRPRQAFPQVLERRLQASGTEAEVFNVALFGWSTRQERIAYERIARRYRPDQVLLGVCLNDIPELQNNLTRPPPLLSALYRRSALVRRLVRAREREIADVEELFAGKDSAKVKEAFGRFFAEVRALRDEVQADGGRFGLLVFPFRFQVRPGAPPPSVQEAIAAFCRKEKIPFLDLLPALQPLRDAAFVDYDHLSPGGARRVAEEVLSSGLVPGGGAGRGPSLDAPSPARGATPDASALVAALGDPRLAVRTAAAWDLGDVGQGGAGAVSALLRLLSDSDPRARAAATYGLGGMGEAARSAVPALVERLADGDDNVRWRAADALGQVGMEAGDALGPLIALVQDRGGRGRGLAVEVVGRLGAEAAPAVPTLVQAIDDPREEVRWRAVWALGEIGPPASAAVPALLRAWKDRGLRWRIADALGGIGPAAAPAVPTLTAALADDNSLVRWRAASALGFIGPAARSAVPALLAAVRHPEPNVRWGAIVALDRMDAGAQAVPAFAAALADEDVRVRGAAAAGLGRLGPAARSVMPALVLLLKDPEPSLRVQAARALGRTGILPASARAALEAALLDERPRVREEAARALGRAAP
jgi:HEAT repeat protein/lysophospholipase L1-like esterase